MRPQFQCRLLDSETTIRLLVRPQFLGRLLNGTTITGQAISQSDHNYREGSSTARPQLWGGGGDKLLISATTIIG